ncbi:MAG: hypothetical protein HY599_04750 [Candidatus Omnitrophica bacterium]|nr:hypothetical protein [Candidatus Omnitrophota bacterium]
MIGFSDPVAAVEWWAMWLWRVLVAVAAAAMVLGSLSAAAPARSIALYQRIMTWCNWRVEPIDPAHELRTTRLLGWLLIGLGCLLAWRLV